MKRISLQTTCPCCSKSMLPASLKCADCELELRGKIETNEFASLPAEDLHLLRIFVWAEGRVRDMEAPLGLTYPTIRNRLGALKKKLRMDNEPAAKPADPVNDTLDALEAGEVNFEQALEQIKNRKKGGKQ